MLLKAHAIEQLQARTVALLGMFDLIEIDLHVVLAVVAGSSERATTISKIGCGDFSEANDCFLKFFCAKVLEEKQRERG